MILKIFTRNGRMNDFISWFFAMGMLVFGLIIGIVIGIGIDLNRVKK